MEEKESSVALLCTDLVSDESVLQMMSSPSGVLNLLTDRKKAEEMDLSFLNDPLSDKDVQPLNFNTAQEQTEEGGDVVMIDVTQPIQLSQNSLIVVNGQKCVLQQDPCTGQVLAYPVKSGPRRRRGRPRKSELAPEQLSPKSPAPEKESVSEEEEREKGLLNVFNDDGSWVRRSSRKRKKAKVLKDYETGNLRQELGSDVEEMEDPEQRSRRKQRGPGRPKKSEGVPKEVKEASQAFLVQTADGQTLMLQVPLTSIPQGTTLQEVAQDIARKLNAQAEECKEQQPALQDHSIGSTTSHLPAEEEICQEITLTSCDENASLVEDHFCLDVSSTTSTDVHHPLSDHSFYVLKQSSAPDVVHGDFQLFGDEDNNNNESGLLDGPPGDILDGTSGGEDASTSPSEVLTALLSAEGGGVQKSSPEVPPGPQKCKICAVPYVTEEEIIEHFKCHHPRCICLECHYMSEHPYGIKRHSYRHAGEECRCAICNKTYKDLYILRMHVKMVHLPADVLFKCDACSKEFRRKAHLKRHQRIHAPTRQHRCPLCDYQGCERSDVTKHLLIHEEPKFKCEFCGKPFRHLKNMELHRKRHSGQRDYKCGSCHFYGYTYTDIRKHIERRHSHKL